jgi:hypothetical protein
MMNGLIDAGVDVGLDLVDGDPVFAIGAFDVGARESGSTRAFGSSVSSCP